MKNKFLSFALVCLISFSMASCYTVSYAVGSGSQTGETITEKNHYLVAGLATIKTANPTQMAGDAKNYQVTITHTFVDGLINVLTSGMYTPTTTIVKK
jgi:predicted small secreted protein